MYVLFLEGGESNRTILIITPLSVYFVPHVESYDIVYAHDLWHRVRQKSGVVIFRYEVQYCIYKNVKASSFPLIYYLIPIFHLPTLGTNLE